MFNIDKQEYKHVFDYAANEEHTFEMNLIGTGKERQTTFFADLSIAEWVNEKAVLETVEDVCKHWIDNVEYFAEFILSLNYKCWEWYERKNEEASKFYSNLFYQTYDYALEYYDKNSKCKSYLISYLD